MATTTNYGWTTPDDTALVKDGAAAIRTLGSSVDTTTKNLNPETTLGDLAYRSSTANVKTRLGLGTAGQVLTVNSGANAPEWATPAAGGGMTLLSTTTLSGASTTISNISQDYNHLVMIISSVNISTTGTFNLELNGTTQAIGTSGTDQNAVIDEPSIGYIGLRGNQSNMLLTNTDNAFYCEINNYASSTLHKTYAARARFVKTGGTPAANNHGGGIIMTTAISSLKFSTSGTFSAGTVLLYGVK